MQINRKYRPAEKWVKNKNKGTRKKMQMVKIYKYIQRKKKIRFYIGVFKIFLLLINGKYLWGPTLLKLSIVSQHQNILFGYFGNIKILKNYIQVLWCRNSLLQGNKGGIKGFSSWYYLFAIVNLRHNLNPNIHERVSKVWYIIEIR